MTFLLLRSKLNVTDEDGASPLSPMSRTNIPLFARTDADDTLDEEDLAGVRN